jgi:hypothetical protein
VAAPGWFVTVAEFLRRAVEIRVVAEREHRATDPVEQPPGLARRIESVAICDVAGADEYLRT